MTKQYLIEITTEGRGLINITSEVAKRVVLANLAIGLCNVFLHHTSASLTLCENYDPLVAADLEGFMQRLAPDGDPVYKHNAEGNDDMPSHIRTVLTQNSITLPVTDGKLALGAWQGLFLWEHRFQSHVRKLTVTVW